MNKSILIGNGINIAFSQNDDYKNFKIIERLTKYLDTERYSDVFNNSIESKEIKQLLEALNDFFKNMLRGLSALKLTEDEEEMRTLIDIARRYNQKPQELINVGIEDYFFVMKLVYNKVGDSEFTPINSLYDGLKMLFLDSIYNDGAIEELHSKMGCYSKELQRYNEIFTVNYDTNIDKLTDKEVHHLHGSFDVLDDTYRVETVNGLLASFKDSPPRIIETKSHLYCNAIMAYSGKRKKELMDLYSNANMALDNLVARLDDPNDIEAKEWFKKIEKSSEPKDRNMYISVKAKQANSNLRNTEYPINIFKNISGELHVLGMSPNNDSHIFEMINSNSNIKRVIYFSASSDDSTAAQAVIKHPLQIRNVHKYWESLR